MKEKNKTYYTGDPFYPVPNSNIWGDKWWKRFPHTTNYNKKGFPVWKYPYKTVENFSEETKLPFWLGIAILSMSIVYFSKRK